MKNFIIVFFSTLVLSSCQESLNNKPVAIAVPSDSTAIADAIHGFYAWYDHHVNDRTKDISFTKVVAKHTILDLPMLDKYLAGIKESGFVSTELLDNDKAYYKACEKLWQNENADEDVLSGMDADKYFCAQDWDINFWTKLPVRIKSIGTDKVAATLFGTEDGMPREQNFELKKENGKWLLSKIECDMGLTESASAVPSQSVAEKLAAFYTGTLPCSDCDEIATILTLNADDKRTFTLEEAYKGKKGKTVENNGTWTIAEDIVTLNGKSGALKYQLTNKGLISLNTDGSKRDKKSAEKYLLTKVLGE